MGRCTYRFRPKFYTFVPYFNDDDQAANVTYNGLAQFLPFAGGGAAATAAGYRGRSFLGATVTAQSVQNTSGDAKAIPMISAAGNRCGVAAHELGPPIGGPTAHWVGIYRWANTAVEAASNTEGYLDAGPHFASRGHWLQGTVNHAADEWDGLAGVAILSGAEYWYDDAAPTVPEAYNPGGVTHDVGPVAGGLTVFPIPPVDTHTAASTVRKIIAPMDLRVHGVTFIHDGSGAGNTLQLKVGTSAVTPAVALTGANFESKTVWPVGGDAQFVGTSYRDIKAGDEIDLVKTGANAMTSPMAFLTCTPRSHFNETDYRRDIDDYPTAFPAKSGSNFGGEMRGSVMGPAAGGVAFIPLGQVDLAASQAGATVATVKVPFACEVLAFVSSNRETVDPAATHRIVLENTTQSTTICTSDSMYNYYSYYYYNAGWQIATWNGSGGYLPVITNPSCDADDVLTVKGTTGVGETFDKVQMGVYVRVTGFTSQTACQD